MFKQMLAAGGDVEETLGKLRYPLYASPKLDGIRGTVLEKVISRNLKPLPNIHLQEKFKKYKDYDGEFIVGDPVDKKCFRNTTSVVMSKDKPVDDVTFHVFDHVEFPGAEYDSRRQRLVSDGNVMVVPQFLVSYEHELLDLEQHMLNDGYEGLILRSRDGRYKFGRSTLNEGYLIKLKRFVDDEAIVIGFEEKMHNANEKTLEKNGKAARSSHQEGLVPLGTLGAIIVNWNGVIFNVGSGFDAAEAQEIWDNRPKYLGRKAKFKYFPVGMKEAPRHPVFLGWVDDK